MTKKYNSGWMCQIKTLPDIYMDAFGYKEDGFFIEVGAFDCWTWSNTSMLVDAGWGGIYFEPVERWYNDCMERYARHPKVTVIRKAISNYVGVADIHLGGSLSTIHEGSRAIYLDMPDMRVTGLGDNKTAVTEVSMLDVELNALAINGVIQRDIEIDVVVIDVEGSEIDVLQGFSIDRWMPKMFIIETHELNENERLSAKAEIIDNIIIPFEYEKIYTDHINSIYTRRDIGGR